MQTPWEYRYAHRTQKMGSSVIRELLKFTEQPDIISFAGGLPAPDVFPLKEFQAACNVVLETQGAQALQYSTTEGYQPLREMIARHNARFSVQVTADNIMITSGSQQALDFIGRLFVNRGDYIVVESPTYLGALQAWNAYGAQYISVPSDENGMIMDKLEEALRIGPKFIYILPNFQNPSGSTSMGMAMAAVCTTAQGAASSTTRRAPATSSRRTQRTRASCTCGARAWCVATTL